MLINREEMEIGVDVVCLDMNSGLVGENSEGEVAVRAKSITDWDKDGRAPAGNRREYI